MRVFTIVPASAEAMESELAELSAHLEAATHRQLSLIRELEPSGIWAMHGARSYAGWLSWRIGLAPGAAREKIRVARALGALPAIDDAFRAAKLSYSKVRALTRVADASNEAALLDMALCSTAAHLELICRGIRRVVRDERGEIVDHGEPPARWVRERVADDGMVRIEAQLHPDEAALVWKAIELARGLGGDGTTIDRADALVQVRRPDGVLVPSVPPLPIGLDLRRIERAVARPSGVEMRSDHRPWYIARRCRRAPSVAPTFASRRSRSARGVSPPARTARSSPRATRR